VLDINALPDDVAGLKRLVLEHHAAAQAKDIQLRERDQQIEHLKFQLAKLRRARFGQSSEQMDSGQLPLSLEELKAAVAEAERADTAFKATQVAKGQPVRRKKLPEHFEHSGLPFVRWGCLTDPREIVNGCNPGSSEGGSWQMSHMTTTGYIEPDVRAVRSRAYKRVAKVADATPDRIAPKHG
jgi:hypothetical protein